MRRFLERHAARFALAAMLVAGCLFTAASTTAAPAPHVTYIVGSGTSKQEVVVAGVDGSAPTTLGPASEALLSPDGSQIAALDTSSTSMLQVYQASGGTPRTLYRTSLFMQLLAWSPDSKLLLVAVGTSRGQLLVFNVADNSYKTIALGVFKGASFAPGDGDAIVYALADSNGFNLFVTTPAGAPTRQLTRDDRSEFPVWGRRGIVYSRMTPAKAGAPAVLQLWFIRPGGAGMRQLTDVAMPGSKFTGLTPIGFSADGEHLLANLVGPNWYEPYALDLSRAKAAPRDLGSSNGGTIGDAISSSGLLILATKGSLSDQAALSIEEIRWSGGKPTVIAKSGAYPSWNR